MLPLGNVLASSYTEVCLVFSLIVLFQRLDSQLMVYTTPRRESRGFILHL